MNIAYSAIQAAGFDFIFSYAIHPNQELIYVPNVIPAGFMGHQSLMGCLLAFSIPLMATRKTKYSWVVALLLFIPLWIAQTSLCFLMGCVGLMFVLFYRLPRKVWIGILSVPLLMGVVYLTKVDKLGTERFVFWHTVLGDYVKHPITGYGLDSFANITPSKSFRYMQTTHNYKKYYDKKGRLQNDVEELRWWDNPHNLYISLLYEWGLFGIIIFAGFMRENFTRFRRAVKTQNTIGLMGFMIVFLGVSCGHFPVFVARLAVCIVPLFAIYEVSTT